MCRTKLIKMSVKNLIILRKLTHLKEESISFSLLYLETKNVRIRNKNILNLKTAKAVVYKMQHAQPKRKQYIQKES